MLIQKKSSFMLVITLLIMAFISVSCEKSYEAADGSLATPTMEGENGFPNALPSDMEGVFESGAQTSTALAAEAGAPVVVETAAVAEIATEGIALTPEGGNAPVATVTPPVVATLTSPPPPTAAPVTGKPASYTLRKGEFPYCIARRFNVDPSELLNLNGLSSVQAQSLQPGLTLNIPQSGLTFPSTRALNAHPAAYTTPQNTTVYAVACHFGDVDPAAIMSANNIPDANNIAAGTALQIP